MDFKRIDTTEKVKKMSIERKKTGEKSGKSQGILCLKFGRHPYSGTFHFSILLVIFPPYRNEKFLASVAAGKWVLHKSFLEASREANSFVDEEEHEWGSGASPSLIAASAKRWRLDLLEKRKVTPNMGAFVGWVVLLCVDKSRQPGFKRLLEAGGAKVLAIRPPFQTIEGATHAFIAGKCVLL